MYFDVVQGNITRQTAHAMVNTTAPECRMECGVSGTFRDQVEGSIVEEVEREQPLEAGDVVVTDAYNLPALYLLHTVPVSGSGSATEASIRTAIQAVLQRADHLECHSLALPLLGCGGGGFDLEAGAICIGEEIQEFDPEYLADVRVVCRSDRNFEILMDAVREVRALQER
ncbi:macro domain-containing protein [Haloarcula sp. CGMCC 1.2071]|uniref:macro domain-containing protein n=1 Tax=Haloarcula sp. CGMCC 1.2071 TaxID=3111454 RepID=UPI00300F1206